MECYALFCSFTTSHPKNLVISRTQFHYLIGFFFIHFAAHLREEDKVNLEDNFDLIQVLGTGGKRSMAFSTDHSVVLNKY